MGPPADAENVWDIPRPHPKKKGNKQQKRPPLAPGASPSRLAPPDATSAGGGGRGVRQRAAAHGRLQCHPGGFEALKRPKRAGTGAKLLDQTRAVVVVVVVNGNFRGVCVCVCFFFLRGGGGEPLFPERKPWDHGGSHKFIPFAEMNIGFKGNRCHWFFQVVFKQVEVTGPVVSACSLPELHFNLFAFGAYFGLKKFQGGLFAGFCEKIGDPLKESFSSRGGRTWFCHFFWAIHSGK